MKKLNNGNPTSNCKLQNDWIYYRSRWTSFSPGGKKPKNSNWKNTIPRKTKEFPKTEDSTRIFKRLEKIGRLFYNGKSFLIVLDAVSQHKRTFMKTEFPSGLLLAHRPSIGVTSIIFLLVLYFEKLNHFSLEKKWTRIIRYIAHV